MIPYARSVIQWGDYYEHDLELGWEPDARSTWRAPAAGWERNRSTAYEASWLNGWDYYLQMTVRWQHLGPTPASSGLPVASGWTAFLSFLDYARDGRAFRFVPDRTVPDFYVDACYLGMAPTAPTVEVNGALAFTLVIRTRTTDFAAALRGVMFEYVTGGDTSAATFARASTAAYRKRPVSYSGPGAVGATVATGVLRDKHIWGSGDYQVTLIEGLRTQVLAQPIDLNHAEWVAQGTIGRTGSQADPFGGTDGWLLDSNTPAASDAIIDFSPVYVGNQTKGLSIFLKKGTASRSLFGIWDGTAGTSRHRIRVTWAANGTPTLTTEDGSGDIYPPVYYGDGWWWLAGSANGVIAANANQYGIYPDSLGGGGTVYAYGPNTWNASSPASPQTGSTTRNKDDFVFPWPGFKPQPMFIYASWVEIGHYAQGVNWRVAALEINADWQPPAFVLYLDNGTSRYGIQHYSHLAAAVQSIPAVTPSPGDLVEFLGVLNADGSVQGHIAVNGGATTSASVTSAAPMQPDWSLAPLIGIGQSPNGASMGQLGIRRITYGALTFGGVTVDTLAKARAI